MADDILQALNDIAARLLDGVGDGDLAGGLGDIINEINNLSATLEARSVAGVVGQNSNFADLIAAINAKTCPPPVYRIQYGCFADSPPLPPMAEFDAPPNGWYEPDVGAGTPEYYDRKCDQANVIIDSTVQLFNEFDSLGVEALTALGVSIAAGLIAAWLSSYVVGPFAPVVGFGVTVTELAIIAIQGGWDASVIVSILTDHRAEAICALYTAGSTDVALSQILAVLQDHAANPTERNMVSIIYSGSGILHSLFADSDEIPTPPPGSTPCDCGESNWVVTHGNIQSVIEGVLTVQSVNVSIGGDTTHHQVRFYVPDGYGDGTLDITVSEGELTDNEATSGHQGAYTDQDGNYTLVLSGQDIEAIIEAACIDAGGFVAIGSGTPGPFTLVLDFSPGGC